MIHMFPSMYVHIHIHTKQSFPVHSTQVHPVEFTSFRILVSKSCPPLKGIKDSWRNG